MSFVLPEMFNHGPWSSKPELFAGKYIRELQHRVMPNGEEELYEIEFVEHGKRAWIMARYDERANHMRMTHGFLAIPNDYSSAVGMFLFSKRPHWDRPTPRLMNDEE